jgi:hypothetical protein
MAGAILASNIRWAVRQLGPFHETDISMIATPRPRRRSSDGTDGHRKRKRQRLDGGKQIPTALKVRLGIVLAYHWPITKRMARLYI